jgi:23S rRNA (uracil747-C5)-methyltransferase
MGQVSTFCRHFDEGRCRSCAWLGRDYGAQLAEKDRLAREALSRALGPGLEMDVGSFFEPAVGTDAQRGFRNRAKLSVSGTTEHPVIGITGPRGESSGELVDCPVHHPRLNELVAALPELIRRYRIEPYRIDARVGELKGVIAYCSSDERRASAATGEEGYLRWVLRSRLALPALRSMLPELESRFGWLKCVSANLQPVPHALLEGEEEEYLTDAREITRAVGGLKLRLSPRAFVQTHEWVAERLYLDAARWIGEARVSSAAELYCGQGAFSFAAAGAGAVSRMLGIEINADAVAAATRSARELGLAGLSFVACDAAHAGGELGAFAPELLLVNPPRRGLGKDGLEVVRNASVRHLIYSSCSVESLARDLASLPGYRLVRARVFDMFPHTEHFETLVWLERA